jgi:hypothetical protein
MKMLRIFLSALVVLLSAGCADANERGVAKFEVVWSEKFSGLDDLRSQSPLGVHGIIVSASPPYIPGGGTVTPEQFDQSIASRVQTDYTLRVVQVLTGQLSMPQDIVVTQLGASIRGISYEIRSDPLYGVGEEVIVFLTEDFRLLPFRRPGYGAAVQYVINQTAQARFRVRDGRVFSVSDEYRLPGIPASGVPLSDFLARASGSAGQ